MTYLLSKKQLSGREARWLDLLAEFDMTISHKPGRENIADPISRALQSAPSQVMDDDSGNSATLGSVIGEFCQDEETVKQFPSACPSVLLLSPFSLGASHAT